MQGMSAGRCRSNALTSTYRRPQTKTPIGLRFHIQSLPLCTSWLWCCSSTKPQGCVVWHVLDDATDWLTQFFCMRVGRYGRLATRVFGVTLHAVSKDNSAVSLWVCISIALHDTMEHDLYHRQTNHMPTFFRWIMGSCLVMMYFLGVKSWALIIRVQVAMGLHA